ncbi:flagellar assembly protein FliW [Bdellovibrio bacteriovorus]|uniref:Flagellar assembly factor FliW n=1 Tax=Bdellovibrio bacteriovorus TaxID=959 RepID=A0A162H0R0_BDEBC|nr:flagellar assembly protein FliW [Bdellovibrio bacteriovorus]KYG69387.1 flagellar assembly protein FliW [Bdellovibrio bacteriovorus]
MIISTSRFGQVELKQEDVLTFPEGLLGFGDLRKFALLDDPNDEIFAWLQSCEAPQIAFPVLEPELFAPQYKATLTKSDMEALKLAAQEKARYFSIVTIPDDPTQMTANLKAPVVVNVEARTARQCVLQDNNLAIREPIFTKLQQRVVQNPAVAIKNQSSGIDVATKLNIVKEAGL